jgi:hypothetical protein
MKTSQVIEAAKRFSKPYRITNGKKFRLTDVDPGDTGELTSEDKPRALHYDFPVMNVATAWAFALVLAWWLSNTRAWQPDVAQEPG